MALLAMVFALTAFGCADAPEESAPTPRVGCTFTPVDAPAVERVWCADDPVVIVVDEAAPCPTLDAIALWSPLLDRARVEVGPVPVWAEAEDGHIYITRGPVPDGDHAMIGDTVRRWRNGVLVAARVTVEDCGTLLLAHELGHALGFGHGDEVEGRIMSTPIQRAGAYVPPEWLDAYAVARGAGAP